MLHARTSTCHQSKSVNALFASHKKTSHSNRLRLRRSPSATALQSREQQGGCGTPPAVLVLPGFLMGSTMYSGMLHELRALGYVADVVPMSTADWVPVLVGSSFEWYLARAADALDRLHARHGAVALVGHSAGGWIARLLCGSKPYQGVTYARQPLVQSLVTLGTPHWSKEAYPFGRVKEQLQGMDLPAHVQGSSLAFTNFFYPTAVCLRGLRVTCVCGDAIHGRKPPWRHSSDDSDDSRKTSSSSSGGSSGSGSSSMRAADAVHIACAGGGGGGDSNPPASSLDSWFAFESYRSGLGRGDVPGDGVTPLDIAFLDGAEQLVLPGVWHTPSSSQGRHWYGDAAVVAQWEQYMHALQPGNLQQRQGEAAE